MAKINLEQFPQLKEQADYIIKVEGLVEKTAKRIYILKNMKGRDELKEIERQIAIDKAELDLQGWERELDEKKKKYNHLIGVTKEALKSMELNYNDYYKEAMETDDGKKIITQHGEITHEESRFDLFLKLRQYLKKI